MPHGRQQVEIQPQALILTDCGLAEATITPGDDARFRARVTNDGSSAQQAELFWHDGSIGWSSVFDFNPGEAVYGIRVPYETVLGAWGLGTTAVFATFVGATNDISCGALTLEQAAAGGLAQSKALRVAGGAALGGIAAPILIP